MDREPNKKSTERRNDDSVSELSSFGLYIGVSFFVRNNRMPTPVELVSLKNRAEQGDPEVLEFLPNELSTNKDAWLEEYDPADAAKLVAAWIDGSTEEVQRRACIQYANQLFPGVSLNELRIGINQPKISGQPQITTPEKTVLRRDRGLNDFRVLTQAGFVEGLSGKREIPVIEAVGIEGGDGANTETIGFEAEPSSGTVLTNASAGAEANELRTGLNSATDEPFRGLETPQRTTPIGSATLAEILHGTTAEKPITDSAFTFVTRGKGEPVHVLKLKLPTGRKKVVFGNITDETTGPDIRLSPVAFALRQKNEQALKEVAREIFELNGRQWHPKIAFNAEKNCATVFFGDYANNAGRQNVVDLNLESLQALTNENGTRVFTDLEAQTFLTVLKNNPFGRQEEDSGRKYTTKKRMAKAEKENAETARDAIKEFQKRLFGFKLKFPGQNSQFGARIWDTAFEHRLRAKLGEAEWANLEKAAQTPEATSGAEAVRQSQMPDMELVLGAGPEINIDNWGMAMVEPVDVPEEYLGGSFDRNFGGNQRKQQQAVLMLRAIKATLDRHRKAPVVDAVPQAATNRENPLLFLANDRAISQYAKAYELTNREVVEVLGDRILSAPGLEKRRQEFEFLKSFESDKIAEIVGLNKRGDKNLDTKGAIMVKLLGQVLSNPNIALVPAQYMQRKQKIQTKEGGLAGQGQDNRGVERARVTISDIEGRSEVEGISIFIKRNGRLALEDIRNLGNAFKNDRDVVRYLVRAINGMGFAEQYKQQLNEFRNNNDGAFPTLDSMVEVINQLYPIYKSALERKQNKPGQKAGRNAAEAGKSTGAERVQTTREAINQRRKGGEEETGSAASEKTVKTDGKTAQTGDRNTTPTPERAVEHLRKRIDQTPEGNKKTGLLALAHLIGRMNKVPEKQRDDNWRKTMNEALKFLN